MDTNEIIDFLQAQANLPKILVEHSPDKCGICAQRIASRDAARELLSKKEYSLESFSSLTKEKWHSSKPYKIYQDLKGEGLQHEEILSKMQQMGIEP